METYHSIAKFVEGPVFKDKKSKFIGYAIPVSSPDEITEQLDTLRLKHPNAAHLCYAWQLGHEVKKFRANDDGEPHNSAGMPILGQINALKLTNILVVVIRYYGGKKLGVGGLIHAYRSAAKEALERANIIEIDLRQTIYIQCTYDILDRILQKARRYQWTVLSKKMDEVCIISLAIRPIEMNTIREEIGYLKGVVISEKPL